MPAQAGIQRHPAKPTSGFWIPACETVSPLRQLQILLFCHSGLDPESSAVSNAYVSGCRIKSGMTIRDLAVSDILTHSAARE